MRTSSHWAIFTAANILLLALTAMVNDGLAGWSLSLFIAGPCVVWPALRLPPPALLGCLALSGLAADAQLPTPPGFLMILFLAGALLIQLALPWLGSMQRARQIGLAWLVNALYFAVFTSWAVVRNQAHGVAFWEHAAVDFFLSQLIVLPVTLWFFDFQNSLLALAGLTAAGRRVGRTF